MDCHKKFQEGTLDWQVEAEVKEQKNRVAEKRAEESAEKLVDNMSALFQLVPVLIGLFILYTIGVTIFNAITGNTGDGSYTRTIDVDCQRDPAYCEALDQQRYEHENQQQDGK